MEERIARVESQVARLADQIGALERRLAALESGRISDDATVGAVESSDVAARQDDRPATGALDAATTLSLIGRTLLVLAGAFLLRALTDWGTLRSSTGVLIGMAYACAWIVMADRAAARGRRASASFHGLAFALIGLPVLFEATLRFRFLSTPASAAALTLFGGVSLLVAWRQRMRGLAWIATLGVLAVSAVIITLTGEIGPFAIGFVLLGVTTLWFGYVLDWLALRWPVAFVVDITLLVLSVRAVNPRSADTPAMALVVQVLLLALYLGSFATRTLFLNRDVIPFEVAQSVMALLVGLGGAAYVTVATGVGAVPLGATSLALGLSSYAVALVFVERRQRRRKNFHFYSAAALVFTMTGCALVLPAAPLAWTWAAFALVAASGGRRLESLTLKGHAVVYAIAAAMASGLLKHSAYGLAGAPGPGWPDVTASELLTLTAIAGSAWIVIAGGPGPHATHYTRGPGFLLLTLSVVGLMGMALAWVAPSVAGASAEGAGIIATLRTAALVVATLALAAAARSPRVPEAGWLVYPLLVVTGVKFLFEDFQASRPATLFLAFALYGAALILAPRLRRRTAGDAPR